MEVKSLIWDSEFFGLRIGRVDVHSSGDASCLRQMEPLLANQYDLIYVFCNQDVDWNNPSAELVDRKVVYSKNIEQKSIHESVVLYNDDTPSRELYDLALVSSGYSRFGIDKRLPGGACERLYRRWIEQSVCGAMADYIFVTRIEESICGMVTVKVKAGGADMGLVAVAPGCQGRGVASMLLQAAEGSLYNLGSVGKLKVVTQINNQKACRLYEKNGFEVESITNIYHWWL